MDTMRRAFRQRLGAGIAVLALFLATATGSSGWQTVHAQQATPVAAPPLETPVTSEEPTAPPISDGTSIMPANDVQTQPALSLWVDTPTVTFGRVSAGGDVDPTVTDVISKPDAQGAYYVKSAAVRVTVTGDGPWSGLCSATENGGSATTIRVADGRLEWRLAGAGQWTPFSVGDAPVCFAGDVGSRAHVFDLRLRVDATDSAGTFSAILTYQVVP